MDEDFRGCEGTARDESMNSTSCDGEERVCFWLRSTEHLVHGRLVDRRGWRQSAHAKGQRRGHDLVRIAMLVAETSQVA